MAFGTITTLRNRNLALVVSGDAPRSRRARANLARAVEQCAAGPIGPVVRLDALERPDVPARFGLASAPALVDERRGPPPRVLYGDLSEPRRLSAFLARGGVNLLLWREWVGTAT